MKFTDHKAERGKNMAGAYTMVPYLVTMRTKYAQGDHDKPLSNVDGSGTTMFSFLAGILISSYEANRTFRMGPVARGRTYNITTLSTSDNAIYLEIQIGTRGVRSVLTDEDSGETFTRTTKIPEHVTLRNWIVFPEGGRHAVLFAEHLHGIGVAGFLGKLIVDSMRVLMDGLTTTVRPLTTLEGLKSGHYTGITFKAPRKRDSQGHFLDDGVRVTVTAKYPGARSLKDLQSENGNIETAKVFGVLESQLGHPAGSSVDMGWNAALAIQLPSGHQRSFQVGKGAPGLVYSVEAAAHQMSQPGATTETDGAVGTNNDVDYPTYDDFVTCCAVALAELEGQYSITASTKDLLQAPVGCWPEEDFPRRKVTWNDPLAPQQDT
ncbi:hypothetical protein ACX5I6_19580 [Arthrobacter sp. MMS24-T111]